jgi:hypothetical protein
MKLMTIIGTVTLALAASGSAAQLSAGQNEKVTLTGCAVKGDGDGDGFLLANAVEQTTRTTTTPDAAGSTVSSTTTKELKPARILYWLDDDDDEVEKLMGQLVEVTGEVEGDVKRGEIEVERENGMIELEIKAKGEKITVKLPDTPAANATATGTSGTVTDRPKDIPFKVRKFDVKKVKTLAATCM